MHSDEVDAEAGAVAVSRSSGGGPRLDSRWEVARPGGASPVAGVRMAGFRDRVGQALDLRVLPQPAVVLVLGLGNDPFMVEGGTGHRPSTSPNPKPSLVASLSPGFPRIRGRDVECVEMCLTPGAAYALLGVSPHELEGAIVGLEDLWGRQERQLRERLVAATTWQERFTLVSEFLVRRAARGPSMTPEVAGVWDTIVAQGGRVRVDALAASCGWSRKRLWSRFSAQIGLTPKRAAMLVRFDGAARALRGGASAADVALAHGYADQSHLHRDVLAFAGCTPGALAEG
ncbi:AraC family transcriptional regulator [Streptomyces sp. WAC05374]|uniref:helix-turn-helix domain-containing protein n=1 Tax=Streptomyces sp. WAC05374 TaxID=2487420 RepID=UPI000F896391|nr:helix-turn-helix domain-containing protein [Streptomyces sp. WAC05374]RST19550.1 AraC family transcriptional regulator [Streptomyces sp. WAC05374]TDF50113.1 AraC family transcriptional regulator [Streptomyces sp. WAC05374]TDF57839.1 AraC family transcriptional regulator [Streptomyces sp. WAC05374]TDF60367.1 AraC family transcriptional regulator [Streptomyces sp. WAC05374]